MQGAARVIALDLKQASLDSLRVRMDEKPRAGGFAADMAAVYVQVDLTDRDAVASSLLRPDVLGPAEQLRPIDALIHCAGGAVDQLAEDPALFPAVEDFKASYRLNVETVLNCVDVCLGGLLKGANNLRAEDPVPDRGAGEDPVPPEFPSAEGFSPSAGIVLVSSVNAVSGKFMDSAPPRVAVLCGRSPCCWSLWALTLLPAGEGIGQFGYSSAKGALGPVAMDIAVKFAKYGVRANVLALGTVATQGASLRHRQPFDGLHPVRVPQTRSWTPLSHTASSSSPSLYPLFAACEGQWGKRLEKNPLVLQKIGRKIPRGRVASAWEAAGSAMWLASRSAALVTGQTLVADGGWMLACGTFVLDDCAAGEEGEAGEAGEASEASTGKRKAAEPPTSVGKKPKKCWYD